MGQHNEASWILILLVLMCPEVYSGVAVESLSRKTLTVDSNDIHGQYQKYTKEAARVKLTADGCYEGWENCGYGSRPGDEPGYPSGKPPGSHYGVGTGGNNGGIGAGGGRGMGPGGGFGSGTGNDGGNSGCWTGGVGQGWGGGNRPGSGWRSSSKPGYPGESTRGNGQYGGNSLHV